jgi:hypothetical protein
LVGDQPVPRLRRTHTRIPQRVARLSHPRSVTIGEAAIHEYEKAGTYEVVVKAIDILVLFDTKEDWIRIYEGAGLRDVDAKKRESAGCS